MAGLLVPTPFSLVHIASFKHGVSRRHTYARPSTRHERVGEDTLKDKARVIERAWPFWVEALLLVRVRHFLFHLSSVLCQSGHACTLDP